MQRMVQHLDAEELLKGRRNLLDARIAKFQNLTRVCEDDVVVLPDAVALFELSGFVAKLVPTHQPAVNQQLHGIVKRRPADPVVAALHVDIQRLHIEVPLEGIDLGQNGKPLWRFAVALFFEVAFKQFADLFLSCAGFHGRKVRPAFSASAPPSQ